MKDLHITVSSVSKVIGLIGSVVVAWVFLTSTFVSAGEYHEDQLALRATLVAIQVNLVEEQIDRAEKDYDMEKVKKLEHTRGKLERQQEIIMEKQLEN